MPSILLEITFLDESDIQKIIEDPVSFFNLNESIYLDKIKFLIPKSNRFFSQSEAIQILLSFSLGVSSSLLANFLTNKLKGKTKSFKIDYEETEVKKNHIEKKIKIKIRKINN